MLKRTKMLAQNYPQILWSIFNEHAFNGLELSITYRSRVQITHTSNGPFLKNIHPMAQNYPLTHLRSILI